MQIDEIQSLLGYHFSDPDHLRVALTHRSYFFENRGSSPGHFERYEFLGDCVLDLVLSEFLMKAYPTQDEGVLSKWRASLVNEAVLSEIATRLQLTRFVFLGRSENELRERNRPRLLASTLEAVMAAIYFDGGLECARQFIEREYSDRLVQMDSKNVFALDYKSRLQEWSQKKYRVIPEYRLVEAQGPEHEKIFRYEVLVKDQFLGVGEGASRKAAEQVAAKQALEKVDLEIQSSPPPDIGDAPGELL
jgi:ribonuclease III